MKGYEERILASGFSHYMTKPIDLPALTRLLGELLDGQCVEAPVKAEPVKSVDQPTPLVQNNHEPIYSKLGGSTTLGHVVSQFIDKVHKQIPALEALEEYANNKDDENAGRCIEQIKSLADRLRAGESGDLADQPAAPDTPDSSMLISQDNRAVVDTPIESRLAVQNPAFRPIILKFIARLDTKLNQLEAAISCNDLNEVAQIAHWLKGSGGTVGFDIFTEPAAEMERDAKNNSNNNLSDLLGRIRMYQKNIVVPGNDDESADKQDSA